MFFHCKMTDIDLDTMREHAHISNGAYGGQDMSHLGYIIDPEHSNRNRTTYQHRESGKAILAFRGTDLQSKSKMGDLGSDALLALGLHGLSSRFRNAKKATDAVIEKYGKDNLTVTGHSLGASQALYVNSKRSVQAHAFNPGVSPSMVRKNLMDTLSAQLFKRKPKSNATVYTTGTDMISGLSPLLTKAKHVIVPRKKGHNAHSINNFL
jgi:hypothetical protein